ncbi:MAG: hypothetical protein RL268_2771 [Pseudomonadota bacterium]
MIRVGFRYADTRLFARVIGWWQRHDSAHCEVSGTWDGKAHECVGASFLDRGVRLKVIDMPPEKWRIYEIDRPAGVVASWYDRHAGDDYDVLGLLGFLWRPIRGRGRRWFCSELVADVLGLQEPHRYDVAAIESVCNFVGRRVQ